MYGRILVLLDRSALAECVLPHAVALARTLDSSLVLLHVLATCPRQESMAAVNPLEWRLRRLEAESYLEDVRRRLQNAAVSQDDAVVAETAVVEGDAAEQILIFARQHDVGLILLGSHGQGGLSAWNLGSVALKIVMQARTSVMIVRAYQEPAGQITDWRYRRVLVPLDGSRRAEWVWPLAASLARDHESEILLAHVVRRPEMPRRLPASGEDSELADRVIERNLEEARHYLDGLQSLLPSPARSRLELSDQVPATLHRMAQEEGIDLAVISAHGCTGSGRFPYGEVALSCILYGNTHLLIGQDLPADQVEPGPAELAASEYGVLPVHREGSVFRG